MKKKAMVIITGNLTLKCVGTLTKCPHTAGGRSRRGSPKAGSTVLGYMIKYAIKVRHDVKRELKRKKCVMILHVHHS